MDDYFSKIQSSIKLLLDNRRHAGVSTRDIPKRVCPRFEVRLSRASAKGSKHGNGGVEESGLTKVT